MGRAKEIYVKFYFITLEFFVSIARERERERERARVCVHVEGRRSSTHIRRAQIHKHECLRIPTKPVAQHLGQLVVAVWDKLCART